MYHGAAQIQLERLNNSRATPVPLNHTELPQEAASRRPTSFDSSDPREDGEFDSLNPEQGAYREYLEVLESAQYHRTPPGSNAASTIMNSRETLGPDGYEDRLLPLSSIQKSTELSKLTKLECFSQWARDRWLFELLFLFVSVACLGGIVITLWLHQDSPLPQWPASITINALVSTLSTISRASLLVSVTAAISQRKWARISSGHHPLSDLEMYDDASRGPWGSMLLLWSIGWSDMVALGAIISILGLAIDPFVQQIASFENAPQPMGTSIVPARVIFEAGVAPDGHIFPEAFARVPETFRSLVTQGLYFDGDLVDPFSSSALHLRSQSSGGNVTFGAVQSLAVCSECANVTQYLPPPEHTQKGRDKDCAGDCWRWTLPNDFSTHWTVLGARSTMVIASNSSVFPLSLDNADRLTILNLTVLVPGWKYEASDNPTNDPAISGTFGVAQECTLYWCVNEYETHLRGGIMNETMISSFAAGARVPNAPFFAMKPPGSNSSLLWPNSTQYGIDSAGWINGTFLINTEASRLVSSLLSDLLPGNAVSLDTYIQGAAISSNPSVLRLYSKTRWDQNNQTYFDMSGVFAAVALGMTTVVRSADNTHGGTDALLHVLGTEMAMEVFVRVSWNWIILPVLVELAAVIFICDTLVRSKKHKLPSWKSSASAVLFLGTRIPDKSQYHGAKTWIDILHVARQQSLGRIRGFWPP